jgi:tRNA G18 (ribose-2'-O)-methylase SpoU
MKHKKLSTNQLNRIDQKAYKSVPKSNITIILDNIRSGNNVGSIFRTADAFLVHKIYLCGITPQPPNKEILKTALGSTETVNHAYHPNTAELVQDLIKQGYIIAAVEQTTNSTPLHFFKNNTQQPLALVFGNEVDGVGQEVINLCHHVIEIPQYGTKHSLNVAVSAGMVIWELCIKDKH